MLTNADPNPCEGDPWKGSKARQKLQETRSLDNQLACLRGALYSMYSLARCRPSTHPGLTVLLLSQPLNLEKYIPLDEDSVASQQARHLGAKRAVMEARREMEKEKQAARDAKRAKKEAEEATREAQTKKEMARVAPVPVAAQPATDLPSRPTQPRLSFLEAQDLAQQDPVFRRLPSGLANLYLAAREQGGYENSVLPGLFKTLCTGRATEWLWEAAEPDQPYRGLCMLSYATGAVPPVNERLLDAAGAATHNWYKLSFLEEEQHRKGLRGEPAERLGLIPSSPTLLSPRGMPPEDRSRPSTRKERYFPGFHQLTQAIEEGTVPCPGISTLNDILGEQVVYLPPLMHSFPPLHLLSINGEEIPDTRRNVRVEVARHRDRLAMLELEQALLEAKQFEDPKRDDSGVTPRDGITKLFTPSELSGVQQQVLQELIQHGFLYPSRSEGGCSFSMDGAEERAQAARRADESCADQMLVRALRCAILAQVAYRIPTGADLWEQLTKIKEGRSQYNVYDAVRKHRREVVSSMGTVNELLGRLYVATGHKMEVVAHTVVDPEALERAAEQVAKKEDPGLPEVAPGWFLCHESECPTHLYISIAGTQNINDIFRDCTFVPVEFRVPTNNISEGDEIWPGAKVHKGFLDGAQKLLRAILPEVSRIRDEQGIVSLHFTGHSLGGATAMLLAAFFVKMNLPGIGVVSLHTYGAPNVFHIERWDGSESPVFAGVEVHQFVNNQDIVPRGLGSPVVRKLAKVAIRMGIKSMACVTAENAECLPAYRFVGPVLHHITPPATITSISDRAVQAKILQLRATDMRPQGGLDHKQGAYIARLLSRLNEVTGFEHQYSAALPTLPKQQDAPSVSSAIFDTPETLSMAFTDILKDLYERIRVEGGGVDEDAICMLFHWAGKIQPVYTIQAKLKEGGYEMLESGDPPQLSYKGFERFMEAECFQDTVWVGDLLDALGWSVSTKGELVHDGREAEELNRANFPTPIPKHRGLPLSTPTGLTPTGHSIAVTLFYTVARPLPLLGHPLLIHTATDALGNGLPVLQLASLNALAAVLLGQDHIRFDPAGEATSMLRNHEGCMDSWGCIFIDGFLRVFHTWCLEDEARVWGSLSRIGFAEDGAYASPPKESPSWAEEVQSARMKEHEALKKEAARREAEVKLALERRLELILRRREAIEAMHGTAFRKQ